MGGAGSPPLPSGAGAALWRCPAELCGQHGSVPAPLSGAHRSRTSAGPGAAGRGAGAVGCSEVMGSAGLMGGDTKLLPALAELNKCPFVARPGALGRAGTRSRQPQHGSRGGRETVPRGAAAVPPPRLSRCQRAPPLLSPAQGPPAQQPAAVPGPVRRGHPVPAGDGVLPAGECRASPATASCPTGAAVGPGHELCPWQGCRVPGIALPRWARLSPPSEPRAGEGDGTAPQGDLKGYLRSCRGAEAMAPDPLTLQRMACEVACGVLHLHRNNYIHRWAGQE